MGLSSDHIVTLCGRNQPQSGTLRKEREIRVFASNTFLVAQGLGPTELQDYEKVIAQGPGPTELAEADDGDRYYMPSRSYGFGEASCTYILPRHPAIQAHVELCQRVLGIQSKVIWTSDTHRSLDADIQNECLPQLARLEGPMVVPYEQTGNLLTWTSKLNLAVMGDTVEWCKRYNHKALLHPHIRGDREHYLLQGDVKDLPVVEGFVCSTGEDLNQAYTKLQGLGFEEFYLKPVDASSGSGIQQIQNRDQLSGYDFPFGDVLLERAVNRDRDAAGNFLPPLSMRYLHGQILNITHQIIDGWSAAGNIAPALISPETESFLRRIGQEVITALGSQGLGGFNFLLEGGRPILIDPNLGRWNGGHYGYFFQQRNAPSASHYCWWKVKELRQDLGTLWRRLQAEGIAFRPDASEQGGVFPSCYLQGIYGVLIAMGDSAEQVQHLRVRATACLV